MVVHTRSGDVLWTASLYGNFVPLRTIAEMHAQSGLRVVTSCYCVTHPQSNPSSMGAELFMADAVALLDSSDIVLTISERTRRELLALAARLEREAPAVQVLQTDSGLRQLPDLDHKESPNATVAQTVMQPNLEIALPDPPLWDEVAAAVEERLQMLVAETDAG